MESKSQLLSLKQGKKSKKVTHKKDHYSLHHCIKTNQTKTQTKATQAATKTARTLLLKLRNHNQQIGKLRIMTFFQI